MTDPLHHLVGIAEFMLPYVQRVPSGSMQRGVDLCVAQYVGAELCGPECRPGCGSGVVKGATVPVAAVDEDRDLLPRECKVRMSGQCYMEAIPTQPGSPECPT